MTGKLRKIFALTMLETFCLELAKHPELLRKTVFCVRTVRFSAFLRPLRAALLASSRRCVTRCEGSVFGGLLRWTDGSFLPQSYQGLKQKALS